MYVHRSVGQVSFVTCDVVLGGEGSASGLQEVLQRVKPETLAIDVSVEDLGSIPKGEFKDPFLNALAVACQLIGDEPAARPYEKALAWAGSHDCELRPIAPKVSIGLMNSRRMVRLIEKAEGETPESKSRHGYEVLLKDDRLGPLAERRTEALAESLTNVVREEPPRLLALFAFPWGEAASTEVRRALGLRRVDGHDGDGGWPA